MTWCRIVSGENYRGYQASKCRYFHCILVKVITMGDVIPVEFCVLPGKFADLEGLAHPALQLPDSLHLIVDSAYANYQCEDCLLEEERINFRAQRKRSTPVSLSRLSKMRIETAFGELMKPFQKKIHVRKRLLPSVI